jgi:hypothetical protein
MSRLLLLLLDESESTYEPRFYSLKFEVAGKVVRRKVSSLSAHTVKAAAALAVPDLDLTKASNHHITSTLISVGIKYKKYKSMLICHSPAPPSRMYLRTLSQFISTAIPSYSLLPTPV